MTPRRRIWDLGPPRDGPISEAKNRFAWIAHHGGEGPVQIEMDRFAGDRLLEQGPDRYKGELPHGI
jgi:hypothetical protein